MVTMVEWDHKDCQDVMEWLGVQGFQALKDKLATQALWDCRRFQARQAEKVTLGCPVFRECLGYPDPKGSLAFPVCQDLWAERESREKQLYPSSPGCQVKADAEEFRACPVRQE